MSSFFEKLKKGMGMETGDQSPQEKTEEVIKNEPESKPEPKPKKPRKKKPASAESPGEVKTAAVKDSGVPREEEREQKIENKEDLMEQKNEVKIEKREEKKWPSFSKDQEGQLAIDVYQTEEFLVIQSAIAGIKPESLDIVIEGDMVAIKGIREKPEEKEDRNYFYQECFWGPFSRQIILSLEVDPGRAEALLKDGILTIKMPKIERDKKRKLVVKG